MKTKSKNEFVVQVCTALALFVVIKFIAKGAIEGRVTQGQMVMYFLALYRGYSFLQELLFRISGLFEDSLFLRNFFEFVDYEVQVESPKKSAQFLNPLLMDYILKNLSFKYPNSSRHVFKNINFRIKPDETIALVGVNGAGKTTLVKLLCGLYQPNLGSIKIDGVDMANISNDCIAKNISVVFQDFMLYNVSARENIWFGNTEKKMDDDEIFESAKKSGIDDVLSGLPKGYQTTLGNLFKDSEMLSVGEWQRMALSRSFFNDAQLVILDEPTSSLDAFTEAKLIDNFKEITKGRMAIIVSHQLSTIHLADRVVVLSEKGIAEQGTMQELINKKGVFYNMVHSIKKKWSAVSLKPIANSCINPNRIRFVAIAFSFVY